MFQLALCWASVWSFPDGQDWKQEDNSNRSGSSERVQRARQQEQKRSCWGNGKGLSQPLYPSL